MNKANRTMACSLALLIGLSAPSYAWDAVGHMAVAHAAYQKLSQKTKDRVDALLKLNPDRPNWLALIPRGTSAVDKKMMLFMIAATWPDRIKGMNKANPAKHIKKYTDDTADGNRPDGKPSNKQNIGYADLFKHKYWHFIDMPFSDDNTPLDPIPDPNAETQIMVFRAVLATDSPAGTSAKAKLEGLKSYDLTWLLHLVGDVHQPLHCIARFSNTPQLIHGDAGGNSVKLCASPCRDELHGFWDSLLGVGEDPTTAVQASQDLPPAQAGLADDLNAEHWIQESFAARVDVYKNPPIGAGAGPFTLTDDYKAKAKTIAQARASLAGARLAKILNDELK